MERKLSDANKKLITDYIEKIKFVLDEYDFNFQNADEIFELLIEIAHVFETDIPQIKESILLRTGTENRDANTVIALLKKYLADFDIEYKENVAEENINVKRFGHHLSCGLKVNCLD